MTGTPSRTQKIQICCLIAQLIPVHGTKPFQMLVTSPPSLGWMTSSRLKCTVIGPPTLCYLGSMRGEMLEILDLSQDLPCFEVGLAKMASLHQTIDLRVKNLNLMTLLAELIAEGVAADNFR